MRWSMFAGANGRYTPRCEDGVCALTGNRATSKLEADIFTLLDYVLGPGIQDFQVQLGNRRRRIDMLFPLTGTSALVVEYDGAHWHLSREEADWEKSRARSAGWDQYRNNIVVRIREHPLDPLEYLDVCTRGTQRRTWMTTWLPTPVKGGFSGGGSKHHRQT
ncbi:hypothetical protein ACWEOS_29355 [Micromonospora taraxaci]